MTPKEKAKELVDKFFFYDNICIDLAKRCALICVNEIQESQNIYTPLDDIIYWSEVKQEIEIERL